MITHTRLEAGEGMADGHDVRRMEDEEDFLGDERQSEDEGEGEDLFGENMADDYVQNEELDRYDPTMLDDYVRTYSYGRIVRRWTHAMSNTTDCRQSRCQCSRSASLALTLTISIWFLVSLPYREAWLQNARSQRRPNRSGLNRSG